MLKQIKIIFKEEECSELKSACLNELMDLGYSILSESPIVVIKSAEKAKVKEVYNVAQFLGIERIEYLS